MKRLLTVLVLLVVSVSVQAAMLKYSYVSGQNRICVYDDLGSEVYMTIPAYELCPLVI